MLDTDALEQCNGMLQVISLLEGEGELAAAKACSHVMLKEKGASEEAYDALDAIIEEVQSSEGEVFELAIKFLSLKKIIAAKACANYLLIENPDDIDTHVLMMEIYEYNKEFELASTLCDQILEKGVSEVRRKEILQVKYWCCNNLNLPQEKQEISSELGAIKNRENIQSFWRHLRNHTGKETSV